MRHSLSGQSLQVYLNSLFMARSISILNKATTEKAAVQPFNKKKSYKT